MAPFSWSLAPPGGAKARVCFAPSVKKGETLRVSPYSSPRFLFFLCPAKQCIVKGGSASQEKGEILRVSPFFSLSRFTFANIIPWECINEFIIFIQ